MKKVKKQNKLKNTKSNLIIYLAIITLALVFISIILTFPLNLVEVKKLDVTYIINNKTGFDLNSSTLTFGSLVPGSIGTRVVHLENYFEFPIDVSFYLNDDLKNIVSFNNSVHHIETGGNISIPFTLTVPVDAVYGNYSSFVVVKIRK